MICQVPGQAVVSGEHQGRGDMREVTRPHPKTGSLPLDNSNDLKSLYTTLYLLSA